VSGLQAGLQPRQLHIFVYNNALKFNILSLVRIAVFNEPAFSQKQLIIPSTVIDHDVQPFTYIN